MDTQKNDINSTINNVNIPERPTEEALNKLYTNDRKVYNFIFSSTTYVDITNIKENLNNMYEEDIRESLTNLMAKKLVSIFRSGGEQKYYASNLTENINSVVYQDDETTKSILEDLKNLNINSEKLMIEFSQMKNEINDDIHSKISELKKIIEETEKKSNKLFDKYNDMEGKISDFKSFEAKIPNLQKKQDEIEKKYNDINYNIDEMGKKYSLEIERLKKTQNNIKIIHRNNNKLQQNMSALYINIISIMAVFVAIFALIMTSVSTVGGAPVQLDWLYLLKVVIILITLIIGIIVLLLCVKNIVLKKLVEDTKSMEDLEDREYEGD